jgi:uncharacterized membrane protein
MRERNIGARDRMLRLVASVVLVVAGIATLELGAELLALAPIAMGLVALVTAVTGRSPLYTALGISTLQLTRVPVGPWTALSYDSRRPCHHF